MAEIIDRTLGAYPSDEGWAIIPDAKRIAHLRDELCPHARRLTEPDQLGRFEISIPRLVVASTECGYNHTYVCLDCILEAAKEENA